MDKNDLLQDFLHILNSPADTRVDPEATPEELRTVLVYELTQELVDRLKDALMVVLNPLPGGFAPSAYDVAMKKRAKENA